MKKIVALFFIVLCMTSAYAVSISSDLASLDTFLTDGLRIDANIGFEINQLELTFPIRYGKSYKEDLFFAESGLLVKVHPVEGWNLFAEVSFLKVGWMWGIYAPKDQLLVSTEGSLGWDFRFRHFFLSPRVTFRDAFSSEMEKNECLSAIPQFSPYRLSILLGVDY